MTVRVYLRREGPILPGREPESVGLPNRGTDFGLLCAVDELEDMLNDGWVIDGGEVVEYE